MKKLFVSLAVLASAALSCVQAQNTPQNSGVLFTTLLTDTVPYRIPAIAKTIDGDLLAISDFRYCRADIGYGRVDLHARISADGGETWGKEFAVVEGTGVKNATDCGFGDAAIVADRESNDVLLVCVCGQTVYFQATRENPNRVAVFRSHDNGKTWSNYKEITEPIYTLFDKSKIGPVQSLFFGSGRIFQSSTVKVGSHYRLYAALCARPGGNRVVYSDDFGDTWHALGDINISPAPNGDEPKCEELPDGRILLSSRVKGGRLFNIYTFKNVAKGTGSWENEAFSGEENQGTIAKENSCNGEILILPAIRKKDGKQVKLALQSVPLGKGRRNVGIYHKDLDDVATYKTSEAFAANWAGPFRVSKLESAYSTMIQQANGNIAFLYEELTYGAGYCIVYKQLSLEEITSGEYSAIK